MSTRAMAHQYMAGGSNSTMPRGGNGPDIFGFQHRRQLETMRVQTDLDKELASHQAELEKNVEAAKEAMAEKLRNNSTVIKAATEAGIPVDKYVDSLTEGNIKNAKAAQVNDYRKIMNAGTALDPDQNPNILKANQSGANAAAMGIDLNKLNTTTPPGAMSVMPSVPGLGMTQVQGGTQKDTTRTVGGFPMKMPDGSIQMVGGKPIEEKQTFPGKVITPPNMSPMSPNELPSDGPEGELMQDPSNPNGPFGMYNGKRNTTTPQGSPSLGNGPMFNDEADRNSVSPMPANQLKSSGNPIDASISNRTTPQDWSQSDYFGKLKMLLQMFGGSQAPQ